jgi:hypothetical protein
MAKKSYLSCYMSVTVTQQKDIDKVLKKYLIAVQSVKIILMMKI